MEKKRGQTHRREFQGECKEEEEKTAAMKVVKRGEPILRSHLLSDMCLSSTHVCAGFLSTPLNASK